MKLNSWDELGTLFQKTNQNAVQSYMTLHPNYDHGLKIGDTVIPAQHFGPQLLDQRFPAGPNIPHKVVNISPYMDAAGVNATNVDMVPVQQDLTHPQVAQQQVVGQNLYPGQKI